MFSLLSDREEKVLQFAIDNEAVQDTGIHIVLPDTAIDELLDIVGCLQSKGYVHCVSTLQEAKLILKQPGRDYFKNKKH